MRCIIEILGTADLLLNDDYESIFKLFLDDISKRHWPYIFNGVFNMSDNELIDEGAIIYAYNFYGSIIKEEIGHADLNLKYT